jgi:hypothetical protein
LTSQPSAGLPLQSPQPLSQEAIAQDPLVQAADAWLRLHALPHPPQWLTLVWVLISQPLLAEPSQFSHPALHVNPHAPLEQVTVACGRAGHTFPQDPQLVTAVFVLVSQPLLSLVSQLPHPVLQDAMRHALLTHSPLALAKVHALPQKPQ